MVRSLNSMHCGSPEQSGTFAKANLKPASRRRLFRSLLHYVNGWRCIVFDPATQRVVNRIILPTLNYCEICPKREADHKTHPAKFDHTYVRDGSLPVWRGWHAVRRGLATNFHALGVRDTIIQRILRHSNVSVTMPYYVKPLAQDVADGMANWNRNSTKKPLNKPLGTVPGQ